MTFEVASILVVLIAFNFGCPFWFYRESKQWEMALLAGGLLWFIEAFLSAQLLHGTNYDPLLNAFALSIYIPFPFILGMAGLAVLAFKKLRKDFFYSETIEGF